MKRHLKQEAPAFRPVLMTTLTTILGLIPMAFFGGSNAMMIQPIGLTVVGGLASSTLITLFFIPVMYTLFNKKKSEGFTVEKVLHDEGTNGIMKE
jgi:HAE1 family hydrophobic/amphiphilic exporter-1